MSNFTYTPPPKPTYASAQDSVRVGLINPAIRFVRAKYEVDGKPGTLFKTFDDSIKVNDLVIVPTDTRVGFTVNVVSEIDCDVDFEHGHETAQWIAAVIDVDDYRSLLTKERDALSTMRKAQLRQQRERMATALFENQQELLKQIDLAKPDLLPSKDDGPTAA